MSTCPVPQEAPLCCFPHLVSGQNEPLNSQLGLSGISFLHLVQTSSPKSCSCSWHLYGGTPVPWPPLSPKPDKICWHLPRLPLLHA